MPARLLIAVIAATALLFAQQPLDPTERLVRARNALAERDKRLPDYTCVQTVDRRYFKRRHMETPPPGCNQIRSLSPDTLVLEMTDRLRLDLKVSQGVEIGAWSDGQFTSQSIFGLIDGGPYGTGTLGALISDVFLNGSATYGYTGEDTAIGTRLWAYSYQVPAGASHYQVRAGSHWIATAFHGAFWLDANSLDLERITEQATELPPETFACEAETAVDYQKVKIGAGEFLVPRHSSLRLVMQNETEAQIDAVYSGCREYRSEATIRFDQLPATGDTKTAEAPAAHLPKGLTLSLGLTDPIDTDTAAAGDIVRARVRRAVRDHQCKAVVAPAGSIVEGRIVQIQHWLDAPRRFQISLVLERLETGGVWRPLYARVHRQNSMLEALAVVPVGQSAVSAPFVFETNKSRYRVPAGYETEWITVELPEAQERNK